MRWFYMMKMNGSLLLSAMIILFVFRIYFFFLVNECERKVMKNDLMNMNIGDS